MPTPLNSISANLFHLPVTIAMSPFIAAILQATFGALVDEGRDALAKRLKEGDATYEQLHKLIERELDHIKSKLEGQARKELLTSISFYGEGVDHLYEVKPNEADGRTQQTQQEDVGSSGTNMEVVSFAEQMRSLQVTDLDNASARALDDAKDRFKQAREKATEAFWNLALRISDRILAMKYRIMAAILEKVDHLNDALVTCRVCLKELHSMPAVKKSIDVHLQQGFMSMFNKIEREDTIHSVCLMNRLIFLIAEIVEEDTDISLWPCIDCGDEKVDPLRDVRVTETIEKEDPQHFLLKTWPFFQEGEETRMFKDWFITTNTKRQLVIVAADGISECALLKLFDRNGNLLQSLHLNLSVTERTDGSSPVIRDIGSDRANNVLLLVQRHYPDVSLRSSVTVFDQHANFQHEFDVNGSNSFRITASDDNKVFVSAEVGENTGCVLVYNFNGVQLSSFQVNTLATVIDMTSIDSEDGKIMVLGRDRLNLTHVCQFSQQGNVLPQFNDVFNYTSHICFLHKTEHVAMLKLHRDKLLLYDKNSEVVRKIKLNLSALTYFYAHEETLTVTTQGLVAMLATEKRTGKRMIVIL